MKIKSILALLLAVMLITACAQTTPTSVVVPPTQPASSSPYPPPVTEVAQPTSVAYPGPTSATTQSGASLAEQAAIQEVSKKYNLPADQIKVLSTEPMTWDNGCMGVVIPGVLCTNLKVSGFIIKLQGGSQQFEIHSNQDGTSVIDAAQQLGTLNFVTVASGTAIQVVTPNLSLGPTYNPAFNGFLPTGGSISGTAYVLSVSLSKVMAVNSTSQNDLTFIQKPSYGLAIWRGGLGAQPLLAWGTQLNSADQTTSLMIASPDGSNQQTLLTVTAPTDAPFQLVAELWSADGKSLYFSKEPFGIGGYILFSGASNLYKIDIATKEVSEIIPQQTSNPAQICLDAISGDYRYVADHCTKGVITVRDLQASSTATIQLPAGFATPGAMGSARFSPSGDRVAFGLAKQNPNDEQGWVAIGSRAGGTAQIILTSDTGIYYNVLGWLDDQTLLVQSFSVSSAVNQILTVSVDGSTINTVADGTFLAVIDNR